MRTPFLVIASHRRWRGNPVNYARAYARLYYDWIATIAMLPRDESSYLFKLRYRLFSHTRIHCVAQRGNPFNKKTPEWAFFMDIQTIVLTHSGRHY